MVDLLYRYRNEKRTADIVALPIAARDRCRTAERGRAARRSTRRITDLFRAPEYRGFTLASLDPSDSPKDIEIPEAKLKEEYDQRQDELQLPERRDVEQILAPSEEKAKEAEAALAAGKDWREVATTIAGQDPDTIDLGLLKREEMPSRARRRRFRSCRSTSRASRSRPRSAGTSCGSSRSSRRCTQTFDQAKPKLEAELTHQEAVDRIYKVANKVDDALAGGATLDHDAAAKFGLKTTAVARPSTSAVTIPKTSRSRCRSPSGDV